MAIKNNKNSLRQRQEIEKAKEYFEIIFKNAPDTYYLIGYDGVFIEGNKQAEKLTGYKREELVGKSIFKLNLIPKSQLPQAIAGFAKNKKGVATGPDEWHLRRKDGSLVFVETMSHPVKIDNKKMVLGIARDISKRKEVEEKAIFEKKRAEQYFELAGVIFVVIGSDEKVIKINKQGAKMLEGKEEEIIGKKWITNFIPRRDQAEVRSVFNKVVKGKMEGVEYFENYIKTLKGNELFVAWNNTYITDKNGNITAILGSGSDITEKKIAQEKIENSEKRFREMTELLPGVVYETNEKGRITFANKIAFDLFGYSPKDIEKGIMITDLIASKDFDRAQKNIAKIQKGERVPFAEYSAIKKDGNANILIIT